MLLECPSDAFRTWPRSCARNRRSDLSCLPSTFCFQACDDSLPVEAEGQDMDEVPPEYLSDEEACALIGACESWTGPWKGRWPVRLSVM